ncbi:MAG: BBE domain-containing protein [Chitinophagaceae bacterium]
MNPAVLNAFALAIIAGNDEPAFSKIKGHEPDVINAKKYAAKVDAAMSELLHVVPDAGSYVSESSFFLKNWQQSFWGSNYKRLATVKKKYDPEGLFFVHHGVGSEKWSTDGFTRVN